MKELWKILFGTITALLAVGIIYLVSRPPRGYPIELVPPGSPAPLIIHISGAVIHPGVYRLPPQSRVWDAAQAAGGFAPGADQEALNLAAFVEDGSQIVVPEIHDSITVLPSATNPASAAEIEPTKICVTSAVQASPYPRLHFPIDINTATGEELEALPQIGQVRAARIIAYRSSHGPFKRIEDIRNVYDITPEVYAAIRDLIIASPASLTPSPSVSPSLP